VLSFPPFRLDLDNERPWKDGAELRLRRKPFALLRHFVQHPQRLVTHEEIVEAVWGKVATIESLLPTTSPSVAAHSQFVAKSCWIAKVMSSIWTRQPLD
jgi:hypothetical protein